MDNEKPTLRDELPHGWERVFELEWLVAAAIVLALLAVASWHVVSELHAHERWRSLGLLGGISLATMCVLVRDYRRRKFGLCSGGQLLGCFGLTAWLWGGATLGIP